jgi:uncharacterized membrane protein
VSVLHPRARQGARRALRIATSLAALVLAGSVLLDPYTFRLNGSDAIMAAPWWHPVFALMQVALLLAAAAAAWARPALVLRLLIGESLLNVVLTMVYVHTDDISRFAFGVGASSYLQLYLALVALRLVLALLWTGAGGTPRAAAGV